jgi:hypothetical protein
VAYPFDLPTSSSWKVSILGSIATTAAMLEAETLDTISGDLPDKSRMVHGEWDASQIMAIIVATTPDWRPTKMAVFTCPGKSTVLANSVCKTPLG